MSRSDRFLAFGVAGAAVAWGWPGLTSGYEGLYDEGNTLCAAWRVLGGESPYRDFWLLHPPGTTWLLAVAFKVFGATLGVERGLKLAVAALAAVLVFLLARRVARPGWAAAAALLFIVLPTQTLSLRSRDTGLVLVLATLAAACAPSDRPRRRALVAGLLAGATFWFKQDFVVAAAVAGAIAVGAPAVLGAPAGRRFRVALADALVPFVAGLVAGLVLLVATLAAHGTFKEFFDQAILFPTTSFGRFRSIPLGLRFEQLSEAVGRGIPLEEVFDAALVPALFVAALAAAVAGVVRGGVLASSVACFLLLSSPYQRADLEHLNPALALALVALAALATPRGEPGAHRVRTACARAAFAAVALAALAALPGARGAAFPAGLLETARLVASSTAPGERIFVGNARHDLLAYNAPLLYFLAGRRGATRYDNLHTGVATTLPVQEEIVGSLERARTRCVVLWDGPPPGEPNESSRSSGVFVLDAWLASHGREAARIGSFRVLRIEGPAAASTPAR